MKAKILLVDDNITFREAVKDLLDFKRYDVLTAKSPEEALEEAKKKPQLAIVDLRLKDPQDENDLSGLHLVQELQRQRPKMPVIMLSANDKLEPLRKIINTGGGRIKYLFKGEETSSLVAHVDAALAAQKLHWLGWLLLAASALTLGYIGYKLLQDKAFLDKAFLQGVVSSLVASLLGFGGGWLLRRAGSF